MMVVFWALFMLPLSLAKEINSLRYASLIGMISTGFLVAAIVTHAGEDKPLMQNVPVARFDMDMLMSLTVFIFAYCCQTNSFEIYTEMTNRSVNRMTLAAAVSMTACTAIYIVAGVAGSADFGKHTDGNILKNYKDPTNTAYITFAFIAISVTLTMAFPICIFPTRDAIIQLAGYKDAYSTPSYVRLFISGSLATSSILVGLFVPGIQVLFGLLGGICGSTLAFIWPALFIMRTGEWTVEKAGLANVIATKCLFYGGIVVGVVGTSISIYQQFAPKSD
jgi:amino acid permease